MENLVLEINSSKYAYNITFKEVIVAVTKGLLQLILQVCPDFNDVPLKNKWSLTKEIILKFKSLFEHYVKTEENQADLLNALEVRRRSNSWRTCSRKFKQTHVYFVVVTAGVCQ